MSHPSMSTHTVFGMSTLASTLRPLRTATATRQRALTLSSFPTVASRPSPTLTTVTASLPRSPTRVKLSTLNTSHTNLSTHQHIDYTNIQHTIFIYTHAYLLR